MAAIVKIDSSATKAASEIASAMLMLRNAVGKLEGYEGLRAQAIGVSASEMQAVFGIEDSTQAQAFSDRWSAFLTAYNGGTITVFSDFVDALTI